MVKNITKRQLSIAILIIIVAGILVFLGYRFYNEKNAVEALTVELTDVSVDRLGLTSCDLSLRLKFVNPTDTDTPTFWVNSYSIYINDNYVGAGSLASTKVTAGSTVYQTTKITLEYAKVAPAMVSVIKEHRFTLTIKGVISAKILFDLIPVSREFTARYVVG